MKILGNNGKKTVAIALTAVMFIAMAAVPCDNFSVKAASSSIVEKQDKIKELEDRNKQLENEISKIDGNVSENQQLQDLYWEKLNNAKDQIDNYNNLLYYMEQDISAKQADISALDLQISAKEKEISDKQDDIEELKALNEKNLKKFGEILRAMYVTENSDIFSVLAESTDIYDLLVRTKIMVNVSSQNEKMMNELKKSIEETEEMIKQLEVDVEQLNTYHIKLDEDMKALEASKSDLLVQQEEAQKLSNQYNSYYKSYTNVISDLEAKQQKLENEKKANAAEIAEYEKQIQREIQQAQQGSNQEYQQGEWRWPVELKFHYMTTYFGWDAPMNRNHSGIDIGDWGINGTNVYASKSGTVITAKDTYIPGYSYGKYVVIDHGDGYSTLYGHCSAIYVTVGQKVNQGDVIAAVGNTGWSTGPHMHFEVRVNGIAQDPFNYVKKHW